MASPTVASRTYRAVAVPRIRVVAAWTAAAAAAVAFLFEILASVMLAEQVPGGTVTLDMPPESTFAWWSWLYHYTPTVVSYTYPSTGALLALLVVLILVRSLLLRSGETLRKAGLRSKLRGGPEQKSLEQELSGRGWSTTLFRARGRRGLLVAAEVCALVVTGLSTYAIIVREAVFQTGNAPTTTGMSVGLGPKLCLAAGVVAVVGCMLAFPWTEEQPLAVRPDGTIQTGDETGPAAVSTAPASTTPASTTPPAGRTATPPPPPPPRSAPPPPRSAPPPPRSAPHPPRRP